jgi:hypothetical protein
MSTGGLSPRVKWLRIEADQSPTFRTEVKNDEAIPPLPHMLHHMVLELSTGTTLSLFLLYLF